MFLEITLTWLGLNGLVAFLILMGYLLPEPRNEHEEDQLVPDRVGVS